MFGDCVYSKWDKLSFFLGLLSLILCEIAIIPQVYKNFKRKSVKGISLTFVLAWTVGDILNMTGTVLNAQLPTQEFSAMVFLVTDAILLIQYAMYYSHSTETPTTITNDDDTSMGEDEPLIAKRSGNTLTKTAVAATTLALCTCVDARPILTFIDTLPPLCDARIAISHSSVILGYYMAWSSALFCFVSRIPQIYLNYTRKSVKGLSMNRYVINILGIFDLQSERVLQRVDPVTVPRR
jgi:solute carrier family 66 (lysosomal lysine-arginine transporter), member 1